MSTLAPILVAASAAVILMLGLAHLLYTFHGPKLLPRDIDLKTHMSEVSAVITRETTMWGLLFLAGYVFLGRRYWFSIPFRGIILATAPYVTALLVDWV